MEQHPIPQNVTQFQFRLIGDMTIKQFSFLVAGGILAIASIKLSVFPAILRWPVALMFGFSGAALAFLPIEERPLSTWLINFFRSIYSPTEFVWKKHSFLPDYLTYKKIHAKVNLPQGQPLSTQEKQSRMQEYLQTLSPTKASNLDILEKKKLDSIGSLLQQLPGNAQVKPSLQTTMSDTKPAGNKPHTIKTPPTPAQINQAIRTPSQSQAPATNPTQSTQINPPFQSATQAVPQKQPTAPMSGQTQQSPQPQPKLQPEPRLSPMSQPEPQSQPLPQSTPSRDFGFSTQPAQQQQQQQPTATQPQPIKPQAQTAPQPAAPVTSPPSSPFNQAPPAPRSTSGQTVFQHNQPNSSGPMVSSAPPIAPPMNIASTKPDSPPPPPPPPRAPQPKPQAQSAQYLSDVQMPMSPDVPNVLVGMTLTGNEQLIPNTIIEVVDHQNYPVRTVRGNNLGQFFIATPLKNGTYSVQAEHPEYKFNPTTVEAKGEIIPPLKVIAIPNKSQ
jgi:hypothetical protein